MPETRGDPKLRSSVKRRRGDNAGEHFAFFRGAFVIGQQTSEEKSIPMHMNTCTQVFMTPPLGNISSYLCLQALTGKA